MKASRAIRSSGTRLLVAAGLAIAWAGGGHAELQTGLEIRLDAGKGADTGHWIGSSANGYAQAHVGWEPAAGSENFWRAYASVLGLAGHGPTDKYLYDFLAADNIEGYESLRLYSWWLERNQGAWSLRAGALLADEEFTGTDSGGHFLNSSFGWPAFISANTVHTGPAFYAAGLGVRLRWTVSPVHRWQVGIYDGDTFDSPVGDPGANPHGWHYRLGGGQGWFIITETSWRPAETSADRFKLGAWLHTASFADVYRDRAGQPLALTGAPARMHGGNFGIYGVAERTWLGKSGETGSIDSHLRAGIAPADRNAISWVVDMGLAWHGPLPSRSNDVASIGWAYANFSRDYAVNARLLEPTQPGPDFEHVLECSYEWDTGRKIIIQPDFQWITHTGGTAARAQSFLLTLRVAVSY